MRDIGKNIKTLRIQKNLTQDELAEKLFVTRQTVSNYETGKSRPDIDMLMQIAEVTDTDIHSLLYGPAAAHDRKEDYVRFAVGAGICIVLWIFMVILEDYTRELYYSFRLSPRIYQYLFLLPTAFFFSGWTLMQLLSLFTGLRPVKGMYAAYFRWSILLILISAFVYMIPYFVSIIAADIHYQIYRAAAAEAGGYAYQSSVIMTDLHKLLYAILMKYPGVLGLFGSALWLFPTRKRQK